MPPPPDHEDRQGRLQYVGQMPGRGTGSPIVFWRHLRRWAADGGEVRVLAGHGEPSVDCRAEGWVVRRLPHRRWWWPPYRPGWPGMDALRRMLWVRELAAGPVPEVFLVYLGMHDRLLPELGARWARDVGVPWVAVVHDDVRAFRGGPEGDAEARWRETLLPRAAVRLYASPELQEAIEGGMHWPGRAAVLPPIGNGWEGPPPVWRPEWARSPHWVYAGKVAPPQWPELAAWAADLRAFGGRLEVVTASAPPPDFPGEVRAPFATNHEAVAYAAGATVFLSVYPRTTDMPWVGTSFPSKVIEFAATGVPLVITAEAGTAIGQAARRAGFPALVEPGDAAGRATWIDALRTQSRWESLADEARQWWSRDWRPERIHEQLVAALRSVH